jgi:hypothetical protein
MAYRVNFLSVATGATIDHGIVQIWNPSTVRRIALVQFGFLATTAPVAGSGFVFRRSTARGTPGSTITPAAAHETEGGAAVPDSGFLIDLAVFSVQPTLAAGEMDPFWLPPATIASGGILPVVPRIVIPPGQGLVAVNRAAFIFPVSEFGLVIEEL